MIRHTTYSWKFYTAGVEGKVKCKECGTTITKRFTTEYREGSTPDLTQCKEQKAKWESQEHICNKCMKNKCKMGGYYICPDFSGLKELQQKQIELDKQQSAFVKPLSDMLKGTVAFYGKDEYVVDSLYWHYVGDLYVCLYKINKKQPWYKTDKYEQILVGSSAFNEVQFTDEVFEERRKSVNGTN